MGVGDHGVDRGLHTGQAYVSGEVVSFFIVFQESFGVVEILLGFPGIVSSGKTFPFDKEGVASSLLPVGEYGFNFVFVFSFDKVRRGCCVIGSVDIVLFVGG